MGTPNYFADPNVTMTLGLEGFGSVTLLRVEHVTACPWVWFVYTRVEGDKQDSCMCTNNFLTCAWLVVNF